MSKDPAFLFYSQDFIVGTNTMPFLERGQYITILCQMHQQGRLSEETIRFLVGSVSDKLKSKFLIDDDGKWYNERLELEIEKRKAFTASRRRNGQKGGRPKASAKPSGYPKGKPSDKPLGYPTDNLIENENENEGDNVDNIEGDEISKNPTTEIGKSSLSLCMVFDVVVGSDLHKKVYERMNLYEQNNIIPRFKTQTNAYVKLRNSQGMSLMNISSWMGLDSNWKSGKWKDEDWIQKLAKHKPSGQQMSAEEFMDKHMKQYG